MSGIFKGDSIYKSGGGGGGGYKDGGELVDADFIKVENNTISSYDNVSRDPLNFYFEVKDGEVLNSVVELTTAVNATINVYVVRNGLYYLLGNVDGNTVNAGDDYNLTIVGNSFLIENVSNPSSYPEAVDFDGQIYKITKVNSLLWTNELGMNTEGSKDNTLSVPGIRLYQQGNTEQFNKYLNNGWRLPKKEDFDDLFNNGGFTYDELRSVNGWVSLSPGNNNSGLNFHPFGQINIYDITNQVGYGSKTLFYPDNANEDNCFFGDWLRNGTCQMLFTKSSGVWSAVRFVMDI